MFLLTTLASFAAQVVEAILARLLELEGDSVARRATVRLPREAGLRIALVCFRGIVVQLERQVAEARRGLDEAERLLGDVGAIALPCPSDVTVRSIDVSGGRGVTPLLDQGLPVRLEMGRGAVMPDFAWARPPPRVGGEGAFARGLRTRYLLRYSNVT